MYIHMYISRMVLIWVHQPFVSGEPNLHLVQCYVQSLAFVGVFEQMVDTWKSLRRRFHWTSARFSEIKRKTPSKAEIVRKSLTQEQIAKIKAFQVGIWEESFSNVIKDKFVSNRCKFLYKLILRLFRARLTSRYGK